MTKFVNISLVVGDDVDMNLRLEGSVNTLDIDEVDVKSLTDAAADVLDVQDICERFDHKALLDEIGKEAAIAHFGIVEADEEG